MSYGSSDPLQGGGREVKGLMEALQVTAPRSSSSGPMSCLFSGTAQSYPSAAAQAHLTAADASQGIWAAAVLGGSTMYEPETHGLIQVSGSDTTGAVPIVLKPFDSSCATHLNPWALHCSCMHSLERFPPSGCAHIQEVTHGTSLLCQDCVSWRM